MDANPPVTNADAKPDTLPHGFITTPPDEEPATLKAWFRANGVQLVVVAALVALVLRYLHPLDVLLAGFGLSFIIFIHELGHFAAAKLCDVHVKTFSIGMGPALPFCSYRYGETTYKLAMIPIGGFVAMVGEGDGNNGEVGTEETPEQRDDPRNLKNKPVWQRMVIISAGVVMNIVLAACLFVVAYMHGVEESPGVIATVESGGGAWKAGVHPGSTITEINGRQNPWFDDIRPIIFSTDKRDTVHLELRYKGDTRELDAEPARAVGGMAPMLGIAPPMSLRLTKLKRDSLPPYLPGTVYSRAEAAGGGPGLLPGDTIVAMTDPADPDRVTPIDPTPNGLPGGWFDFERRQQLLAGKPVTFEVARHPDGGRPDAAGTARITVPPAFRQDYGLRMRMGEVVAVRRGSPAETAGVAVRKPESKESPAAAGDTLVAIEVPEEGGKATRFTTDATESPADGVTVRPLDPLRLPFELGRWAARPAPSRVVKVTVLRTVGHAPERVTLELPWDAAYGGEETPPMSAGAPLAVNGLGLAYQVLAVVDAVEPFAAGERSLPPDQRKTPSAAARAGLKPNDKITEVRLSGLTHEGGTVEGKFAPVEPGHWAFVDDSLQGTPPHAMTVKYERDGQEFEAELAAAADPTWPVAPTGLQLEKATVVQKADNVLEALQMGGYRTLRGIRNTYQGLYGIVFGDVSVKAVSGPITLGRLSYLIAGQDVWHLILWMAMISINLAVVNFMPIPVLDGGHMVFLIYEGVRGKPAPESVQLLLTYLGLAMVGCLMLFVVGLDVWRLIFS